MSAPRPGRALFAVSEGHARVVDSTAVALRLSVLEQVTAELADRVRQLETAAADPAVPPAVALTRRQREVLALVVEGLDTAAIASRLWLSQHTVRNHVDAILRALGVHSRLEAVAYVHRTGLLDEARRD
jgi:DNA-binding NarL/FixJ family response regulator